MKTCSHCKQEKDESLFYKNKAQKDGLSFQCKSCQKIFVRKYQSTDLGHEMRRRYRASVHVKCREHEARKVYCDTSHGRLSIQQIARRRRDRKRDLDMTLTSDDVQKVYKRFRSLCFHCGCTNRLEIDHHYPLSRGYGLSLQNAVLLCKSCNSSKGSKTPEDFYEASQLQRLSVILFGPI